MYLTVYCKIKLSPYNPVNLSSGVVPKFNSFYLFLYTLLALHLLPEGEGVGLALLMVTDTYHLEGKA